MDDPETIDQLVANRLLTTQIIAFALVSGVLIFGAIVLFGGVGNQPPLAAGQTPIISYFALGVFAIVLLAWAVVPGRFVDREVGKIATGKWTGAALPLNDIPGFFATDTAKLLAAYQRKIVVACALLEGSAFVLIAAYICEKKSFALALAGFAALLMIATSPTRRRARGWIDRQLLRIDQMRQFGS